jgi:hypothetical protein
MGRISSTNDWTAKSFFAAGSVGIGAALDYVVGMTKAGGKGP